MIIYKRNTPEIKINILGLKKPEPILWFRAGLFCVIPVEIVRNAADNEKMCQKFSGKCTFPIITITWDQGIPVDPKVGYTLMGE